MIFTRIRVGDVKPWEMGEKAMCHLPLFYPTTTIENYYCWLGHYGWEWSVVGLSVLSHTTLHQRIEPHVRQENDYAPHSILTMTPLFPLSVHPHAGATI